MQRYMFFLIGCSHIDRRDLREVSKLIGAGLTFKDIDEMLAEVDKDGDDKIQFDGKKEQLSIK